MEKEVWRNINEEGFENLYQVSNFGRGRSLDRYVTHNKGGLRLIKGKIMGQHKDNVYLYMSLASLDHKYTNRYYHILVAKAFPEICGEWFEGAVVHHKDFNPFNNRADNLQVMTKEEHTLLHKEELGKSVIQYTKDGQFVAEYESSSEAERQTGVWQQNISACCLGKSKTAGGFIWKYKEVA